MTTMKNINHWRTKVKEAEKALRVAYENDLPVGTVVSYTQGKHEIHVEIVETSWYYPKVRNTKTGREYRIAYERFDRVIR